MTILAELLPEVGSFLQKFGKSSNKVTRDDLNLIVSFLCHASPSFAVPTKTLPGLKKWVEECRRDN